MIAPAALPVSLHSHAAAFHGVSAVSAKTPPANVFSGLLEELGAALQTDSQTPSAQTGTQGQGSSEPEAGRRPALQDAAVTDGAGEAEPSPQPAGAVVPVVDGRAVHYRPVGPIVTAKENTKSSFVLPPPTITVPVATPLPPLLPLNLTKFAGGPGADSPERGPKSAPVAQSSPEPMALDTAALEIHIRAKEEAQVASKVETPQPATQAAVIHPAVSDAKSEAHKAGTAKPETLETDAPKADGQSAQAGPIRSAEPAHFSEPALDRPAPPVPGPVASAAVTPHVAVSTPTPHASELAPPKAPEPPARSSFIEEPVERPSTASQPVRALSLEFTPDGAGDVRLRLSERTGEVHISLHSSDSALGSRLHEGVHDLVGSLSNAGYEAEAWTPSQGQQQNRRDPDEHQHRRPASSDSGEGSFVDVFEQPVQEVL